MVDDLARELQVDEGTIRTYLDILATLYLVKLVPAWSTSETTRAKKRPVGHLIDTALACGILGITSSQLAEPGSPWFGPLLESFVVGEVAKQLAWGDTGARLAHYRDRDQREIDVVLEHGRRLVGIEVKATATPTESHARHLAALRDRLGDRFAVGVVLHTCRTAAGLGDRLIALPVSALWSA
jgi:predicted AAA+ superfamily ATPase